MPRLGALHVNCDVSTHCGKPAWVKISIGGLHSNERPKVNSCRAHSAMVINDYLAVSNDVRVRKAVKQ